MIETIVHPPEPPAVEPERIIFWQRRWVRHALTALITLTGVFTLFFGFFYLKYARMIEARLQSGPFGDTVNIFSSPQPVAVGDSATVEEIVAHLRQSGYSTARSNPIGWYNLRPGAVEVFPGRDSYFDQEPGVLQINRGKISRIVSLQDNTERQEYMLEPQFIANLSERNRERRRMVHFSEIPPHMVQAVVSAEDKRFFQHSGIDMMRLVKAAYIDLREGRKEQGASTLSMQLARGFFLDPDKNWRRKVQEMLIAMHLEHKLTKQQIFEYYANQVYLGRRGTFSINGFGEGARAFFGKDIGQLNIEEAALLAGMVQRPSYTNPLRYPDRAKERRNVVLLMMRQNGYLQPDEYERAAEAPVLLSPGQLDGDGTHYFIDLMNDEMQTRLDDHEKHTRSIYTTLDPELQRAAEEAVRIGMAEVDKQLRKRKDIPAGQPQVALIALDPHTGEVKAVTGGRSYTASQLNHATAMRQPGSAFKPFVYAAALDTAVSGGTRVFTPASVVGDEPTAFRFGSTIYQPGNFHHQFMGEVTLRNALAHSLNIATVKVAEAVGYGKVVAMARRAGLNSSIRPTPSVALGAYETTPLEIAGAYTVFANEGRYVRPSLISLVRGANGTVLYKNRPETHAALDPRVNYLMVSMLQDVLRYGTGAGVRSRGFTLPAAGKTGTSRDGWFAGFTSELLCVVWVGFDDGRELNLEGARSALPVWGEFMKRAAHLRAYRDATPFAPPAGLHTQQICADSGQLAGPYCPNVRSDMFIDGTEPAVECQLHSLDGQVADRVIVENPAVSQPPQ